MRSRLDSVTSLRFFAALLVVVSHSLVDLAGFGRWGNLVNLGSAGLSFFFLLSGFVLTWAGSTRDGTRAFYRHRFARIYPLHALTWVVAVGFSVVGLLGRGSGRWDLASLLLLQAWFDDPNAPAAANYPSWSLSCELFFYLLFPVVVPFVLRWSARVQTAVLLLLVAVVLALPLVVESRHYLYFFPPTRTLEFLIGILLACRVRAGWRTPVGLVPASTLMVAAVLVGTLVPPRWGFAALYVVPAALLMAAAVGRDLAGSNGWLAAPWLVRLGEASFSLYLVHVLVIAPLAGWGWLAAPASVATAVALSVALSVLVHRRVEVPLERRLRGPRRVPAAAS